MRSWATRTRALDVPKIHERQLNVEMKLENKSENRLVWCISAWLVLCACGPLLNLYAQDENARRTGQDENANRTRKTGNNSSRTPKPGSRPPVVRAAPKVVLASLTIIVTPADSLVWLNKETKEVDPNGGVVLKIPPASYGLIVHHEGFRDDQRLVELTSGENPTLTINLEPLKGTLNIRPSVDGTSIELRSVDRNQKVGTYGGAIDQTDFPPGEYEITISKPGYATATRTFTLKAAATVELEPRLDPLPPPKPASKPRPLPMNAHAETDGKYLIVHLSGTSADDSTFLGSINVSVSKSTLALPEVSGTLNGAPCRIEFFKLENIDEGSLIETPSPSNQYSVIVVRVRPKDAKRPVRFAINWKSIGTASQSPETASTSDTFSEAVPTRKVLPTIPALARSSQTRGSVNVSVVIDEQGNVMSAKAIDGPVVLRQAAENAARQWKFRSATRNGIAIQTTQTIRFDFEK
ncbi:MAG: periplasmic protein TonB [Blastocatellia bacterium]|jgi:TonB family protein|nr:periplasmic protein TonB [Blastocatellia bacterium]